LSWTTLVAAGAFVARDGELLLIRQRRPYGVHWEVPAGYYDPGESLEETARREVLEETNVEVRIDDFLCTLVWEREQDRRRNVLTWFSASAVDAHASPRPQTEEDIEAAAFIDPATVVDEIHPLERAVLDRWWPERDTGFHMYADVTVRPDGTQAYSFR
jgi:ADP-ribose pyrophosphatase YjhB (NUDIX family)